MVLTVWSVLEGKSGVMTGGFEKNGERAEQECQL